MRTTTLSSTLIILVQILPPSLAFSSSQPPRHVRLTSHNYKLKAKKTNEGEGDENVDTDTDTSPVTSRASFLQQSALATASSLFLSSSSFPSRANANAADDKKNKQYNLTPEEIASIVKSDLLTNAFLTTGQLTRSIYDETATFTDEIDTYKLDQWMKGTQRLFVGPTEQIKGKKKESSHVSLVGDVEATTREVSFRFEEDLMFRIPFVYPVVHLTGRVVLDRDENTGLITSYREFWDQDVNTVLKSAKI